MVFPSQQNSEIANLQQQKISQEVQIWRTLIFSPYILKPIFGLISDLFPIAGLHKADVLKRRFGGERMWIVCLFRFVVWCSLVWLFGLVSFVQRIWYTFYTRNVFVFHISRVYYIISQLCTYFLEGSASNFKPVSTQSLLITIHSGLFSAMSSEKVIVGFSGLKNCQHKHRFFCHAPCWLAELFFVPRS